MDAVSLVTPKVHLMWRHVAPQMRLHPGGLGHKREDWAEKQHQITGVRRKVMGSTHNVDQRAKTMAKHEDRDSAPAPLFRPS